MDKLYQRPWIIVIIISLITVFFLVQLPKAELDNNNLRFVPVNDPTLEISRRIDETFGSSFFILIGLERQYGTVFDRDFLFRIRDFSHRIGDIPIVREVTSLMNTDYINSDGDAIVAEKLTGNFTGSAEEIAELRRRILSWELYEHSLVSDDFTATQILIPLGISTEEAGESRITAYFIEIRDAAREMFSDMATVYVTGMPIISATVTESMDADLKLLVPLVIVVVLAVLFFSFRRVTAVILPLLTVFIAVVWSIGAMPLFGIKLSVISTVLPVILIAVGSAYGIHIVTHYLTDRGSAYMDREEHRRLVLEIVRKIRKPVFLAALTTFVGFFSLCFTAVTPIKEFGYFSSFGIFASFIIAITLIPSLLIIRGPKPMGRVQADGKEKRHDYLADTLTRIAGRKKLIIAVTCVILALTFYGFSKIIIDNAMVEYFRPDTDIFKSDVFIRRQFGGSKVVSLVVEAETPEILLHPDTLSAVDGLSVYLQRRVPAVGKILGFTDLVKRINQVWNADESPDGIAARPSGDPGLNSGGDDFGFGSFGFSADADDFGFGSFDYLDEPEVTNQNAGSRSPSAFNADTVFTLNEIIALFDKAGNVSLSMNATDLIRELKRQTNYEGAAYYEIPVDPARYGKGSKEDLQRLISGYLILLSGNISQYANDPLEPTAIKSTIQMRTVGMYDSNEVFREINDYIAKNFPDNVTVTIGGTTIVEGSLNDLIVQSQLTSVIISIICVFIIIAFSNKSVIAGFIGIAPLSISVLINFAVMGFSGIKLNLGTAMVASVSIGVGIDYSIHFLEAFKREFRIGGWNSDFLWRAFNSSGRAILINAASVGAGFAVLLLSRFTMLAHLGLLIAFTMFSSATVSLTVLPALLMLFKPKFITSGQ
jgi:predicted RND superfamily exporter protein